MTSRVWTPRAAAELFIFKSLLAVMAQNKIQTRGHEYNFLLTPGRIVTVPSNSNGQLDIRGLINGKILISSVEDHQHHMCIAAR